MAQVAALLGPFSMVIGPGSHGQARTHMAFRYRRRSAPAKQLGVLAWLSPLNRIIADVALTSDIPVKEDGPDGPEGMPLSELLMIDLTCVPAT